MRDATSSTDWPCAESHAETCALADRTDPPMRGATIQALPVFAAQDRAFVALANHQIDGPRGPRHERDRGWLVALAKDAQRPVAALQGELLDVGPARLRDPQAVEAEQHAARRCERTGRSRMTMGPSVMPCQVAVL